MKNKQISSQDDLGSAVPPIAPPSMPNQQTGNVSSIAPGMGSLIKKKSSPNVIEDALETEQQFYATATTDSGISEFSKATNENTIPQSQSIPTNSQSTISQFNSEGTGHTRNSSSTSQVSLS